MGAWIEVFAETPLCWQVSSAGAQSTNRIHIVSLARYNFSKDTKGIWKANHMSGLRNYAWKQSFDFRFTFQNLAVYDLEVKICEVFVDGPNRLHSDKGCPHLGSENGCYRTVSALLTMKAFFIGILIQFHSIWLRTAWCFVSSPVENGWTICDALWALCALTQGLIWNAGLTMHWRKRAIRNANTHHI